MPVPSQTKRRDSRWYLLLGPDHAAVPNDKHAQGDDEGVFPMEPFRRRSAAGRDGIEKKARDQGARTGHQERRKALHGDAYRQIQGSPTEINEEKR